MVDQLYSGYGESSGGGIRAGKQARLFTGGNAWLDRDFPKLDKLVRATVSSPRRKQSNSTGRLNLLLLPVWSGFRSMFLFQPAFALDT